MSDVASGPPIPGVVDLVPVGRGGHGVVYRGYQPDLGREVAVKVVSSPGTPEEALERWRREVSAMGRLSNHPNIVSVYAGGVTADGFPYLVMPYVPDGSLGDRLRREGPMAPQDVATLGVKLAGALATAHQAGVLHRDVKPDNVLLSPYGEPQLTDFGIARLLDATATMTGSVQASLPYAPPEVLTGRPATAAADVYGLGATLFACLTGQPPFPSRPDEALVALVGRIASQPAPDLRLHGVPDPLADALGRALGKTPEERIPSAEAFQRELEAAARALEEAGEDTEALAATTAVRRVGAVRAAGGPDATAPLPRTAPVVHRHSGPDRPAAGAAPSGRTGGTAGRGGTIAAAVALVLLLAVAAAVVLLAADEDGERTGDDVAGSATSAVTTAPETTQPVPTTAATTTPTTAATTTPTTAATTTTSPPPTTATPTTVRPAGAAGGLAAASSAYVDALEDGDLDAAYEMLSPGLRATQSQASFEAFWGARDVEVVGEPVVDQAARTVTVPLTIDGRREDFQLQLVPGRSGSWLIDGPRPR